MCGIVAVVGTGSERVPPTTSEILAGIERAAQAADAAGQGWTAAAGALERAADALHDLDQRLRGTAGVRALLADPAALETLDRAAEDLEGVVAKLEDRIDADPAFSPAAFGPHRNSRPAPSPAAPAGDLERINAALLRCKDLLWAIRRDRVAAARAVAGLLGDAPATLDAVEAFTAVQIALSALDRLEVRGRDSAGLHILVSAHGLDRADPAVAAHLTERTRDPLFGSTAVRTPDTHLSFVYKAASEIGELGDNVRKLRAEITADDLLHRAVAAPGARAVVLAHTRWASVGLINQANAHPLNAEEVGDPVDGPGPYVVAALNGDVDNYQALIAQHELRPPEEITTDAKVIPVLVARRLAGGDELADAFRATVAEFEGSVAIAANATADPGRILLALRGSGQALYIGLADDRYVVASEPYGVVEQCGSYLRMDGETRHADGSRGQVVTLDAANAGTLAGISRTSYAGTELPVAEDELQRAEITTRDIDRGGAAHYLLKEISEAPTSMRKTLRGRIREAGAGLAVALGEETLPRALRDRLADGQIRRIAVIGQGTAAVAGMAAAAAIGDALAGAGILVEPILATELSGFGLPDDLRDHLVIAISQSGTTTDTNRTVDLVRGRGGKVVAIVNRRGSDLVHKADGVLFTSDGRDVEMSVASTKAFYAQVAAGQLLALALADAAGCGDPARAHELLTALRGLPEAMEQVIAQRGQLGDLARAWAPVRRHWAVTGNGRNRIAAEELRIKLSELCYKSIACDATEDKKHIDLSSEPMTLVCAAGLAGSAADDAAKEVAIFAAHKGVPIVLATEGEARYTAAAGLVAVPAVHPDLAFVLSTVAGHLFGYEAALAIDALARPLRSARAAIERAAAPAGAGPSAVVAAGDDLLVRVRAEVGPTLAEFRGQLAAGRYDGVLPASIATRLVAAVRYADGSAPLDTYPLDFGRPGTPGVVVEDLADALTAAIDELTRPVDAIKHQAKTVTVGTSRSDETLLTIPLVQRLLGLGVPRDRVAYNTLQALAALDPAVAEVTGATRYALAGDAAGDDARLTVVAKTGIAEGLTSRAETDPRLRGTKRLVALERQLLAARGASDGRTVLFVPEVAGVRTTGLTLLHVRFRDRLDSAQARRTLDGYRGRLAKLAAAVTETEPRFDDRRLADLPVEALLTEPVEQLAAHWRST